MVRSAFCLLKAEVEARFKDIADRIVGSVLFLRFICPAIVSPHRYNLDRGELNLPSSQVTTNYFSNDTFYSLL